MILSFKGQFLDKILNCSKIHTIRGDESNRWKPGNKIHFATGVRSKQYNQFRSGVCSRVQDIEIIYGNMSNQFPEIYIDGIYQTTEDVEELAYNDGFDSVDDFRSWFSDDFIGKIIHWTDYKY